MFHFTNVNQQSTTCKTCLSTPYHQTLNWDACRFPRYIHSNMSIKYNNAQGFSPTASCFTLILNQFEGCVGMTQLNVFISLQGVSQVYQVHSLCCRTPWTQHDSQGDTKVRGVSITSQFLIIKYFFMLIWIGTLYCQGFKYYVMVWFYIVGLKFHQISTYHCFTNHNLLFQRSTNQTK